jgi:uncharacterized membrane protein YfbV (UPF0208 family)
MVTYIPLRPPVKGMKSDELERWFFEVYRKIKELEERIASIESKQVE